MASCKVGGRIRRRLFDKSLSSTSNRLGHIGKVGVPLVLSTAQSPYSSHILTQTQKTPFIVIFRGKNMRSHGHAAYSGEPSNCCTPSTDNWRWHTRYVLRSRFSRATAFFRGVCLQPNPGQTVQGNNRPPSESIRNALRSETLRQPRLYGLQPAIPHGSPLLPASH